MRHRAADAGAAAGDQRDAPGQLLVRRGQRQLVELERPVLHVEGVPGRQRHVAAEAGRVADDVDRVVVDVVHDAGGARVAAGGEHAEPGHQHDARQRIGQLDARTAVTVDVGGVVADEGLERAVDRGGDRRRVAGVGERHEARQAPGVDRVIGRGGADLAERGRLRRGDELRHGRRVVEGHDHAPPARQAAAQPRRHVERRRPPGGRLRHRHPRGAEDAAAAPALGDGVLGPRDQRHRRLVGLAHGRAPADRAVLGQQQRPGLGVGRDRVGDLPRDLEARPAIVERDDVLAVHAGENIGRAVVVRQRDDRVGVGVDDRRRLDEAVQQRLDRRPRPAGLLQRVGEIGDHLLVAHVLALEERADVVHPHAREILLLDRLEVRAAALDAQHGDVAAAVIALGDLDRGVAAAPHDQRGLGADEAGSVDEQFDAGERGGFSVVPARSHRASRYHAGRGRGQRRAPTTSTDAKTTTGPGRS